MDKQPSLFDQTPDLSQQNFDYGKGEFKEEKSPETEYITTPTCDRIMAFLDKMNKDIEEQNKELQDLLDELQADWTEDEKLQVRDPKEWQRQQQLKQQNNEPMAKELSTEAIEVLKNCVVDGMVVKLPPEQLDRKTYTEVKNKLELIGGKWKGNKVQGFVFNECPAELLEQIANGENRNLKKEFQFFATPDKLADELVRLTDLKPTDRVLEPSAGQGAIIKAINRVYHEMMVECFEAMPVNQTFLKKINTAIFIGEDFLQADEPEKFDKIIANPPFSKNQDIDHIRKMYDLLKPGGRIVTIASKHWQQSNNKKETEFRNWLLGTEIIEIEKGAFKESGTEIAACIIIIDKD